MKPSITIVWTLALIALLTPDASGKRLVMEGLQFLQRPIFSPGGNLWSGRSGKHSPTLRASPS